MANCYSFFCAFSIYIWGCHNIRARITTRIGLAARMILRPAESLSEIRYLAMAGSREAPARMPTR